MKDLLLDCQRSPFLPFQGVKDVNWMTRAENAKVCTVRKIVYCTFAVLPSLPIHTLWRNMIKYVNK